MSVNPVSQSPASAIAALYQNQIQNEAQQKPAATPVTPRDTVQLSPQAKTAVGDVDHDGDSH
jgi:hypothetical protein